MSSNDVDKMLNAKLKIFEEIDKMVIDPYDENKHNKDDVLRKIKNDSFNAFSSHNERKIMDRVGNIVQINNTKTTSNRIPYKTFSRNIDKNIITKNETSKLNKSSLNYLQSTENTISKNSFDAFKTEINSNRTDIIKGSESTNYSNKLNVKKNSASRNISPCNNYTRKQSFIPNQEVFTRLYPYSNQANLSKDRMGNNNNLNNFSTLIEDYPIFDDRSFILDQRNGTSIERVMKSKNRPFIKKNNNNKNNPNSISRSFSKGYDSAYSKGNCKQYFEQVEWIKRTSENRNHLVKENEISLKNISYKPDNNRLISKDLTPRKNIINPVQFFHQQKMWKQRIINRNEKKRESKLNKEYSECTFKPNIEPLGIQDDEKTIKRNISQIMKYVDKRQSSIKQKKDREMSKTPEGDYTSSIKEPALTKIAEENNHLRKIKSSKTKEEFKSEKYYENTQFSISYLKKMNKNK